LPGVRAMQSTFSLGAMVRKPALPLAGLSPSVTDSAARPAPATKKRSPG